MSAKKILFICGTYNQTTMMFAVSRHLGEYDCYYTPYYGDGFIRTLANAGFCDFCSLGGQARRATEEFLRMKKCRFDYEGLENEYDLVVTCSDLIIPKNIQNKSIIHIQEGMTDPENFKYHLVKTLRLPRYLANTSTMGLSDAYEKFCIMGEGWKDIFITKGVSETKLAVTGLPNFDDVESYRKNDFPYRHYVLAATVALRETFKFENRIRFIRKTRKIAGGRPIIFKLHPNENRERAVREIKKYAPEAMIFTGGNTNHMIANCDVLVTRYSTVVLTAAAMGKEIHSDFTAEELQKRLPLQNGGESAKNIAEICREYL